MRTALVACLALAVLLAGPAAMALPMGPTVATPAPLGTPLHLPTNLFGSMRQTCQRSSGAAPSGVGFPISIPAAGTGAAGEYDAAKLANNTAINATITAPNNPSLSTNQYIVLGVGDPVNATKFTAVAVAETYYLLATVAAPAAYLPNGTLIYNAANLVSLGSTHTYEINHLHGYWWTYTYDGNAITGSSSWENGTYNLGVSVAAGVMCEAGYTLGPSFVALAYGASGAATPSIPTTTVPWAVGVEPLGQTSPNYAPQAANAVPQLNSTLGIVGVQGHDQVSSIGFDHLKVGSSVPYPGSLVPLWGNYKVIILNTSTITPSSATVAFGGKQDFNATAFDENGAWITKAHVSWAFSPATLGTLNTTTGTAVQFTAGSSTVSGRLWANVSYNCSVIHDQANVSVALTGAPAINSFTAAPPSLVVGSTTQFNVSAAWPLMSKITYTYTGLPGGCTSSNTSTLSCSPTQAGFFPVRVYVNDTNSFSSSQVLTPSLAVYPALSVTGLSFTPNTLTWGTWTSVVTSSVGGVPPVYYDYRGGPTGCDGRQPSTFNCEPRSNGTYQVIVYVNDSAGHSGTATASLTVHVPIAIATFTYSHNPVIVGTTTLINVTASGGTPPYHYVYTVLPPGCTSSSTNSLACTPTATGNFTVKVNVTDASGAWANAASPLQVSNPQPLAITSFVANPNPVVVSSTTSLSVTATGGVGTYSYSYTGLPTGCASADTSPLSCTPTQQGSSNVTVTVTDTGGHTAAKTLDLVVSPTGAPSISSFTATPGSIQLGSSTTIATVATGTGTLSYTYTGLPAGCASTAATFSCTPTITGTFTVRVYVNNSVAFATGTVSLTVTPASGGGGLSITAFSALPASVAVGGTSDLSVTATGGTGTLAYAYTGLPGGCATSDAAALACTPNTAGTFTIRVYVNDSQGHSATLTTSLTVTGGTTNNPAGNSMGSTLPLLLLVAVIAVVAVVAAVLLMRRRKRSGGIAAPPPAYQQGVPPEPAPGPFTTGPG